MTDIKTQETERNVGRICLEVAKQWIQDSGWELKNFAISISSVQSGIDFVTVDVTRLADDALSEEEQLRKSRVLEIDVENREVDTVLAARDPKMLNKMLELERSKDEAELIKTRLEESRRKQEFFETAEDEEVENALHIEYQEMRERNGLVNRVVDRGDEFVEERDEKAKQQLEQLVADEKWYDKVVGDRDGGDGEEVEEEEEEDYGVYGGYGGSSSSSGKGRGRVESGGLSWDGLDLEDAEVVDG